MIHKRQSSQHVLPIVILYTAIFSSIFASSPIRAEQYQLSDQKVQPARAQRQIKIIARTESSLNGDQIRLADIAEVSSARVEDDEIILGLKRIHIAESPVAGSESEIPAARVIEAMRRAGVDLDQVGYIIPARIKVARIGQPILKSQVSSAIESTLKLLSEPAQRELSLQELDYPKEHMTIPGVFTLKAIPRGELKAGAQFFDIEVNRPHKLEKVHQHSSFAVKALIDEWVQLPVAGRGITRGEVISNSDVVKARMNLARLPLDTLDQESSVLGLELAQPIRAGDVFRRSALKIPPLITKGSQVTIQYRSRSLEASALGSALEDGIQGAAIRVRNDISKKVIFAKVVEPGLVRIEP